VPEPEHYWAIAGELLAGEFPGPYLDWLEYRGIEVIVNLTEEPYRARGFRVHHVPIAGQMAPEDEQIVHACRLIRRALRDGRRVYVHCHAGCGRTGTIVACYLVYRLRIDAEEAMGIVRALRPCSIETDGQEDAVVRWAGRLRANGYHLRRGDEGP
jgi:atypical dual specificity phosphatase